jgi:hypothetical protein
VSGKADVLVPTLGSLKCWCFVSDHLGPDVFRIFLVRGGLGPTPPSFGGKKQRNITFWSFRYSFVPLILLFSSPPLSVPSVILTRPSKRLHPTVQALHPPPHGQNGIHNPPPNVDLPRRLIPNTLEPIKLQWSPPRPKIRRTLTRILGTCTLGSPRADPLGITTSRHCSDGGKGNGSMGNDYARWGTAFQLWLAKVWTCMSHSLVERDES